MQINFLKEDRVMSNRIVLLISFFLVLALTAVSPAGLDDDPNLAGWWKFDGDAVDSSGNGRDGTLVGDAQLVSDGILAGALSLDGDGDYVTIAGYKGINADRTDPDNPFQKPFTVACWVNTRRWFTRMLGQQRWHRHRRSISEFPRQRRATACRTRQRQVQRCHCL